VLSNSNRANFWQAQQINYKERKKIVNTEMWRIKKEEKFEILRLRKRMTDT
jgi:hypothetical protein